MVGTAAAEIPIHGIVDIGVAWTRVRREQNDSRQDLSRLTIATLGNLLFEPSLLHRVPPIRRKALDGCDMFAGRSAQGRLARPNSIAFEDDRASAALANPASVLRAC
jgi:hypothetical protein